LERRALMKLIPAFVMSVDPGLKTGLALLAGDGPKLLDSREVGVLGVEAALLEMLLGVPPEDEIIDQHSLLPVIEQFTINAKTVRNTQAPWSLEVTGICRNVFWRERQLNPVMQQPSEAMDLMVNRRLRAVDCWHVGGEGHANDAIRHGLYALHQRGWRDRRLL
jgi:hypothetical protein